MNRSNKNALFEHFWLADRTNKLLKLPKSFFHHPRDNLAKSPPSKRSRIDELEFSFSSFHTRVPRLQFHAT